MTLKKYFFNKKLIFEDKTNPDFHWVLILIFTLNYFSYPAATNNLGKFIGFSFDHAKSEDGLKINDMSEVAWCSFVAAGSLQDVFNNICNNKTMVSTSFFF